MICIGRLCCYRRRFLFCLTEGATCLSQVCKESQVSQKFLARGKNGFFVFAGNLNLY